MKFNPVLIALLTIVTAAPVAGPNAEAAPARCAHGQRCFGNGWNVWKRDADEPEATEIVEEAEVEKREAAPARCARGQRCFGNGWNVWKREDDETEASEDVETETAEVVEPEVAGETEVEKREAAPARCARGQRCFGNGWNVWKREDDETEATEIVEEAEVEKREAAPARCARGQRCFGNGWNVWKREDLESESA